MVQTSQALADIQSANNNALQVYLDAVQSAKDRGVFQDRGVLFAVYDPYGKRLKMYHYWLAIGVNPTGDKLTNTQCGTGSASIKVIGALRLKDPKRRVDSYDIFKLGYNCSDKEVGDKTLKYCTSDKGSFYYDPTDGKVVNVTPMNGFICRRQVNDEALREAHVLVDNYERDNNVITRVGQYDAAKIVAKYAYYHKIQYALFIVETYDVKITKSSSVFKKKITYHYYEVPKYYGIIAGINSGTYLGNGYFLVDGQRVGNLFDRSYNEIFSKSKSGWTFLGVVLINLLFLSVGSIFGGPALALSFYGAFNMVVATLQNILDGTNFFESPLVPVEKDKGSPNRVGINPTPTVVEPIFIKNEKLTNDSKVISGDGARHITERVTSGNEDNRNLRGFIEPWRERETYRGWDKLPGGFIYDPLQQ
jgi:hypothetical protein